MRPARVNALLGEALLPSEAISLTSVVTAIRAGRAKAAHLELGNGQTLGIDPAALAGCVMERGNSRNAKHVAHVVLEHLSPRLENGARLIDTPGIGSVYEHNTHETRKYLPQADAVLLVASADPLVSRVELDFLRDIRSQAGKVFRLLNKAARGAARIAAPEARLGGLIETEQAQTWSYT